MLEPITPDLKKPKIHGAPGRIGVRQFPLPIFRLSPVTERLLTISAKSEGGDSSNGKKKSGTVTVLESPIAKGDLFRAVYGPSPRRGVGQGLWPWGLCPARFPSSFSSSPASAGEEEKEEEKKAEFSLA